MFAEPIKHECRPCQVDHTPGLYVKLHCYNHYCQKTLPVPDERHKYSGCGDDDYCIEAKFGERHCGQPRDAACHAVEPPVSSRTEQIRKMQRSGGSEITAIMVSRDLSTQPDAAKDSAEVRHLLQCLAEECAEVIQAVSKALRFGLDDDHQAANPDIVSPRLYIVRELADLDAVYLMLAEREVLPDIDDRHRQAKVEKLTKMMDYAREKGML